MIEAAPRFPQGDGRSLTLGTAFSQRFQAVEKPQQRSAGLGLRTIASRVHLGGMRGKEDMSDLVRIRYNTMAAPKTPGGEWKWRVVEISFEAEKAYLSVSGRGRGNIVAI